MTVTPNRVRRAIDLLKAAAVWSRTHHRPLRAAKLRRKAAKLQPVVDPGTVVYPAIQAARAQSQNGPQFPEGTCLLQVRTCYGIPAQQPTAATAWQNAKKKHPGGKAPRGYPVFWTGGSEGFGHIAIATGDGKCWSTDIRRIGFFNLCDIDEIHAQWGLTYAGWSEDLNGVDVVASKEITK